MTTEVYFVDQDFTVEFPVGSPGGGTTYTAGTGISIIANVIANTAPNTTQTLSIAGQNLSLSGGGGTVAIPGTALSQSVAYATAIPFTYLTTAMATHTVVAPIVFTKVTAGALPGYGTIVRLIANGTNAPSFSAFQESTGSSGYDNSAGILNVISFFFDGVYYWYSVFQEVGAVPVDMTAPVFASAQVTNVDKNKIAITYAEALNTAIIPATTDFAVSGGKTVTNVAIVGHVVTLTVNSVYAYGDVITFSYTAGTNKIQDAAGNFAANLTNQAVTNNISAGTQTVVWENFNNASEVSGFLVFGGGQSGGRGTVPIDATQAFEVFAEMTSVSNAAVLYLDKDATPGNTYVWNEPQVFEAGCFYFGSDLNWTVQGNTLTLAQTPFTVPKYVKFRKSGNDIVLSTSPDNIVAYTDVKTFTNALVSVTTLYIHVIFATGTAGVNKIQVKYLV